MKRIVFLILLLSVFPIVHAQLNTDQLAAGLKERMDEITGFDATAIVKVDVDFINIKDRIVKMKYTAPDQFDFDTEGLALMPKNGMQMEYLKLMNGENTAILAGEEAIRDIHCQKIKVIPEDMESDIVLAQLWMNPDNFRILRMQTFTRESGSYIINFFFDESDSILPVKVEVTFDIASLSAPVKMMNEFLGSEAETDSVPKEAKVTVIYQEMTIYSK